MQEFAPQTAPTVDDSYEVFRKHFEAMARATHQDSPPHASRDSGLPPARDSDVHG